MSLLNEYRATEDAIKKLQLQLNSLSGNPALIKEMEFEEQLRALMGRYGKSLRDIIKILDPQSSSSIATAALGSPRKQRTVKVYRNPRSGEIIETKGSNHKLLKTWKKQYGAELVNSWCDR
jgi:hypothetical protein